MVRIVLRLAVPCALLAAPFAAVADEEAGAVDRPGALEESGASEEPSPAEEPADLAITPPVVRVPAVDPWEAYHAAFAALARGDDSQAVELLEELIGEHPTHDGASRARAVLRSLRGDHELESVVADYQQLHRQLVAAEQPQGLARAELAAFQTLHGIAFGGEACIVAQCRDARAVVGALTLGGLAGLSVSLLVTTNGVTPGQALSVNVGAMWGFWNGLAIMGATGILLDDERSLLLPMGLQLAGVAAGAVASKLLPVHVGQVSMASSFGLWGGVFVLLIHGTSEFRGTEAVIWSSLLVVSDLGFGAGLLLGAVTPMSRSRVLLIDTSSLLGMLLGMGTAVLAFGDDFDPPTFFGAAAAGTAIGFGAGVLLTRHWDLKKDPGVRFGLMPIDGGAMILAGGRF